MILNGKYNTEGKDADLAIFLTPVGGILARGSIKALGLAYFVLFPIFELLLWRVIRSGPACESLFSKTLK